MDSSIFVSVAAQRSLAKQLEIVANNVANANTVGFRSEHAAFTALVTRPDGTEVHYPIVAGIHASDDPGARIQTGNPYDIAIAGDGWFAIQTPAGTAYTRDGRFELTPLGELQTVAGHPVLDSGSAPIILGPIGDKPEILPDGRVLVNGAQVAELGVFSLPPEDISARYGNAGFLASRPADAIAPGSEVFLHQGYVEQSNVNAMQQLANLITITRLAAAHGHRFDRSFQHGDAVARICLFRSPDRVAQPPLAASYL